MILAMNRKTLVAVAIQVAAMLVVLLPPLVVKATGTVVYLETDKMDPRALFRGDYVILGYQEAQGRLPGDLATEARRWGRPVYVTFTTDRPARFVAVGLERPELEPGQVCIAGRPRLFGREVPAGSTGLSVDFPSIAQYFVPEGEGGELERQRGENLLARVAVSGRCGAVLLGLEPR